MRSPLDSTIGVVAVVLATPGCAAPSDPDPLDPDVIAAIAKDEGDAKGGAWSGVYELEAELIDCECPTITVDTGEGPQDVDICLTLTPDPQGAGEPMDVEFTQADGFLAATFDLSQLTGPIDQDGTFTVAGILNQDEPFYQLETRTRLDGSFDDRDDGRFVHGILQQHSVGMALDQEIDCRVVQDVSGYRAE